MVIITIHNKGVNLLETEELKELRGREEALIKIIRNNLKFQGESGDKSRQMGDIYGR